MNAKVLFIAVAVTSLPIAFSQSVPPPPPGIPTVVTNIPFSAQELTTTSVARPDGTTANIVRRTDIARNSAGSMRRDDRILASATSQPTGSSNIAIRDVVNQLSIRMNPTTKLATVRTLQPSPAPLMPSPGYPTGTVTAGPPQDLGTSTIAGYAATGSRQTLLIPPGIRGPNQVSVTQDTWVSPDLQATLLIETNDDLGNSTSTALKQIVPGEPAPALFTVPATYRTMKLGTPPVNARPSPFGALQITAADHQAQMKIPLSELYLQFFLYEAHLEHVADSHPEVPKGGAIRDHMRKGVGLTEQEWQSVSASSLHMEAAIHASRDQAKPLIEEDATFCQSNPQTCSSAAPNLPQLKELRMQRDQAMDAETAALEAALAPDSAAKLRSYLQSFIASHIKVVTIDPAALKAAFQSGQEVSK